MKTGPSVTGKRVKLAVSVDSFGPPSHVLKKVSAVNPWPVRSFLTDAQTSSRMH